MIRGRRKCGTSGSRGGQGPSDFQSVFRNVYSERWPELHQKLFQDTDHVAAANPFAQSTFDTAEWQQTNSDPVQCYKPQGSEKGFLQPVPDTRTHLLSWYWLDQASLLPPLLLAPKPTDRVLDMCAAPGGKSLLLAYMMFAQQHKGHLTPPPTSVPLSEQHDNFTSSQKASGDAQGNGDTAESATNNIVPLPASQSQPKPSNSQARLHSADTAVLTNSHMVPCTACPDQTSTDSTASTLNCEQAPADPSATSMLQQQPGCMTVRPDHPHMASQAYNEAKEDGSSKSNSLPTGSLTCNELDPARRARLQLVLKQYLPPHVLNKIKVTPYDAARWWGRFESDSYDCVLLDAPCSSERHVIQQAASDSGKGAKLKWSLRQCEDIAALQVKLLTAALKAVKPGGRVVYSTCSILPLENDEVVSKVVAGWQGDTSVKVVHQPFPGAEESQSLRGNQSINTLMQLIGAERTELGLLVLPDQAGAGPMYISVICKQQCDSS